jgi:hypothetical protein
MWPPESRVADDFTLDSNFAACLFVLRRDDIVRTSDGVVTAFDAFERTQSARCAAIEALWQLAVASAVSLVAAGNVEMYVEVVYETPPAATDNNPARLTKRQYLQMGGIDTDAMQQHAKAVEYRFFLFVRTMLLYDAEMKRAMNYASQTYLARARSVVGELHVENEDRRRHQAIAGRPLQCDTLFMSDVAGDDERWSLLCTVDRFAAAYAAYDHDLDATAEERARQAFRTLQMGPHGLFDARRQLEARGELARYFDAAANKWRFPRTQHVWRVPPHMMQSTAALRIAYVPDYQQRVVEPLLTTNFFADGEAQLAAHDFLGAAPQRSSTTNDSTTLLDTLSAHFASKLQECAALPTAAQRAQRRLTIQDAAMAVYEDRLAQPDVACHSQTSQTILRYWSSERRAATTIDYTQDVPNDGELTAFGRMVTTLLFEYERLHFVHSSHLDVLLLELAVCNSYWHARELHLNVLLLNDPDQGKSFSLELVTQRAITHSVLSASRVTAAAHSVDGDHNDRVLSFDEYPQPLLVAPRGAGSSRAIDEEKQRLSKCSVTTLALRTGSNNTRRQQSVSESEQIGVTLAASNVPRHRVNAAMASRFAVRVSEQQLHRADGVTVEQRDAARAADESTQRLAPQRLVAVNRQRWLQFLHREVEKQIKTHALHDVTLPVFDVCRAVVERFVRTHLGVRMPPRSIRRVRLVARTLVVRQALWRLQLQPATYRPSLLADADLHLHDTEELVYFALEMMASEFVNTSEYRVLVGLYRLACGSLALKHDDFEYVRVAKYSALKSRAETWRLSTEELHSSINALLQRNVVSQRYQAVGVLDTNSARRATPLIIKDAASNTIYLHCSIIDLSDFAVNNPVLYAIERFCLNAGTPQAGKWVRGLLYQPSTPHLLAVRRLTTHSSQQASRVLRCNDDGTVYMDRLAASDQASLPLDRLAASDQASSPPVCSLDEFAVRERLRVLDLPLVNDAQLEALLDQPPHVVGNDTPTANYPQDFAAAFSRRRDGVVLLSRKRPRE